MENIIVQTKKIEENPNGVANGNARTNIYKLDQKPIDVIR